MNKRRFVHNEDPNVLPGGGPSAASRHSNSGGGRRSPRRRRLTTVCIVLFIAAALAVAATLVLRDSGDSTGGDGATISGGGGGFWWRARKRRPVHMDGDGLVLILGGRPTQAAHASATTTTTPTTSINTNNGGGVLVSGGVPTTAAATAVGGGGVIPPVAERSSAAAGLRIPCVAATEDDAAEDANAPATGSGRTHLLIHGSNGNKDDGAATAGDANLEGLLNAFRLYGRLYNVSLSPFAAKANKTKENGGAVGGGGGGGGGGGMYDASETPRSVLESYYRQPTVATAVGTAAKSAGSTHASDNDDNNVERGGANSTRKGSVSKVNIFHLNTIAEREVLDDGHARARGNELPRSDFYFDAFHLSRRGYGLEGSVFVGLVPIFAESTAVTSHLARARRQRQPQRQRTDAPTTTSASYRSYYPLGPLFAQRRTLDHSTPLEYSAAQVPFQLLGPGTLSANTTSSSTATSMNHLFEHIFNDADRADLLTDSLEGRRSACAATLESLYANARWPLAVFTGVLDVAVEREPLSRRARSRLDAIRREREEQQHKDTLQEKAAGGAAGGSKPVVSLANEATASKLHLLYTCVTDTLGGPRNEESYGFIYKDNIRRRTVVLPRNINTQHLTTATTSGGGGGGGGGGETTTAATAGLFNYAHNIFPSLLTPKKSNNHDDDVGGGGGGADKAHNSNSNINSNRRGRGFAALPFSSEHAVRVSLLRLYRGETYVMFLRVQERVGGPLSHLLLPQLSLPESFRERVAGVAAAATSNSNINAIGGDDGKAGREDASSSPLVVFETFASYKELKPEWDWTARLLYLSLPDKESAILTTRAREVGFLFSESGFEAGGGGSGSGSGSGADAGGSPVTDPDQKKLHQRDANANTSKNTERAAAMASAARNQNLHVSADFPRLYAAAVQTILEKEAADKFAKDTTAAATSAIPPGGGGERRSHRDPHIDIGVTTWAIDAARNLNAAIKALLPISGGNRKHSNKEEPTTIGSTVYDALAALHDRVTYQLALPGFALEAGIAAGLCASSATTDGNNISHQGQQQQHQEEGVSSVPPPPPPLSSAPWMSLEAGVNALLLQRSGRGDAPYTVRVAPSKALTSREAAELLFTLTLTPAQLERLSGRYCGELAVPASGAAMIDRMDRDAAWLRRHSVHNSNMDIATTTTTTTTSEPVQRVSPSQLLVIFKGRYEVCFLLSRREAIRRALFSSLFASPPTPSPFTSSSSSSSLLLTRGPFFFPAVPDKMHAGTTVTLTAPTAASLTSGWVPLIYPAATAFSPALSEARAVQNSFSPTGDENDDDDDEGLRLYSEMAVLTDEGSSDGLALPPFELRTRLVAPSSFSSASSTAVGALDDPAFLAIFDDNDNTIDDAADGAGNGGHTRVVAGGFVGRRADGSPLPALESPAHLRVNDPTGERTALRFNHATRTAATVAAADGVGRQPHSPLHQHEEEEEAAADGGTHTDNRGPVRRRRRRPLFHLSNAASGDFIFARAEAFVKLPRHLQSTFSRSELLSTTATCDIEKGTVSNDSGGGGGASTDLINTLADILSPSAAGAAGGASGGHNSSSNNAEVAGGDPIAAALTAVRAVVGGGGAPLSRDAVRSLLAKLIERSRAEANDSNNSDGAGIGLSAGGGGGGGGGADAIPTTTADARFQRHCPSRQRHPHGSVEALIAAAAHADATTSTDTDTGGVSPSSSPSPSPFDRLSSLLTPLAEKIRFAATAPEAIETDPYLPFLTSDEADLLLSALLWTSGWNFYAPTENVVLTVHHFAPLASSASGALNRGVLGGNSSINRNKSSSANPANASSTSTHSSSVYAGVGSDAVSAERIAALRRASLHRLRRILELPAVVAANSSNTNGNAKKGDKTDGGFDAAAAGKYFMGCRRSLGEYWSFAGLESRFAVAATAVR